MAVACLTAVSGKAFTRAAKSPTTQLQHSAGHHPTGSAGVSGDAGQGFGQGMVDDATHDLLQTVVLLLKNESDDIRMTAVRAVHWIDARNFAFLLVANKYGSSFLTLFFCVRT